MSVWMPQIGNDSLFYRRELSNEYDEYAAAIVSFDHFKRDEVAGDVPFFPKQDVKQVPSLVQIACELKSYRSKKKQRDWFRIRDTN